MVQLLILVFSFMGFAHSEESELSIQDMGNYRVAAQKLRVRHAAVVAAIEGSETEDLTTEQKQLKNRLLLLEFLANAQTAGLELRANPEQAQDFNNNRVGPGAVDWVLRRNEKCDKENYEMDLELDGDFKVRYEKIKKEWVDLLEVMDSEPQYEYHKSSTPYPIRLLQIYSLPFMKRLRATRRVKGLLLEAMERTQAGDHARAVRAMQKIDYTCGPDQRFVETGPVDFILDAPAISERVVAVEGDFERVRRSESTTGHTTIRARDKRYRIHRAHH